MMKNRLFRWAVCLLIAACILPLCLSVGAVQRGDAQYTNPRTGYQALILDDSNLLTAEEESALVQKMIPITDYGHIVFWSTSEYTFDEIEQAKNKRYNLYGNDSSGIFAVNMKARKVTFQSDGAIYSMVSSSLARSITDNVSHYASTGDYYQCAAEAYDQILTVLQGNRIAEPMKYISFIVIGLMLSFVIVVGIVFGKRVNPLIKNNDDKARMMGRGMLCTGRPNVKMTDSSMRLWVQILLILLRAVASSGGSHGGGSSGGGGGGSSGGGGGGGSSSF
ncbi:MAG: TPM domain-containing protein [Ruminococcus sp.]|uniref:TPM domain-containing protein n=1 Tax=Ruminococcus sp. TaxID=41978 RepID=UPI002872CDF7|nr:TPM domain-containing protein [Ruminococcus sp.]MBQ3284796.1 TPM domain-containing protein [Ruminococcus sp.]